MKETARYTEAVGRRKTSVARVRITPASKVSAVINDRPIEEYFRISYLRETALTPLKEHEGSKYAISVVVSGGGIVSQAEAIRHGLASAMTKVTPDARKALKKKGFLKRDSRMKERRKFGLKKARKAAQWSKR